MKLSFNGPKYPVYIAQMQLLAKKHDLNLSLIKILPNLIYICGMNINYLVRKPEVITPKTQLLVMLHGYGSNEEDLFSFVPTLPEDWLIVSLRAPKDSPYGGYSWYDIDFSSADRFIDIEEATDAMKSILNLIRDIKEEYQLTERTHLMGFSQGGILSYSMALTYPELFNKIAILSAYPETKILQNISKDKKAFTEMRFFISHGMEDVVIPLDMGRTAADMLYDLGCFFSFREYVSGHNINQKNYMDLMVFLS